MRVQVEFFGIPRQRAGLAALEISLPSCDTSATLAEILHILGKQLPDFARDCLRENHLRPGYIANVDGRRFLADSGEKIALGETLLILSADVGG